MEYFYKIYSEAGEKNIETYISRFILQIKGNKTNLKSFNNSQSIAEKCNSSFKNFHDHIY